MRATPAPMLPHGTPSQPATGMRLRLIDSTRRDVPSRAEGEIIAQGPPVYLGYRLHLSADGRAVHDQRLLLDRQPRPGRPSWAPQDRGLP
jgi:hypothetical protein